MKLNTDCIRAVLLSLEEKQFYAVTEGGLIQQHPISIEKLYNELPDYKKEDIFYSLYNLDEVGYVDIDVQWASGRIVYNCFINRMTFSGHEFLDKIRDPKRWTVVKGGLSALRNYSLDAINAIAGGVTAAAIDAYIKQNPL